MSIKTKIDLTPKRELFCQEYFACRFNASKAAKSAGYAHPAVAASNLLKKKIIQKRIAEIDKERLGKRNLDIDLFVEHLFYMITRTPADFEDPNTGLLLRPTALPPRAAACVESVKEISRTDAHGNTTTTFEYRFTSKDFAMDLLAKHKGLIAAQKHTVDGEVKLVVDYEKLYKDANGDPKTLVMSNVDYLITHPDAVEPPPTELNGDEHLYKTQELLELNGDDKDQ